MSLCRFSLFNAFFVLHIDGLNYTSSSIARIHPHNAMFLAYLNHNSLSLWHSHAKNSYNVIALTHDFEDRHSAQARPRTSINLSYFVTSSTLFSKTQKHLEYKRRRNTGASTISTAVEQSFGPFTLLPSSIFPRTLLTIHDTY